jgi:hypothetical protein
MSTKNLACGRIVHTGPPAPSNSHGVSSEHVKVSRRDVPFPFGANVILLKVPTDGRATATQGKFHRADVGMAVKAAICGHVRRSGVYIQEMRFGLRSG